MGRVGLRPVSAVLPRRIFWRGFGRALAGNGALWKLGVEERKGRAGQPAPDPRVAPVPEGGGQRWVSRAKTTTTTVVQLRCCCCCSSGLTSSDLGSGMTLFRWLKILCGGASPKVSKTDPRQAGQSSAQSAELIPGKPRQGFGMTPLEWVLLYYS